MKTSRLIWLIVALALFTLPIVVWAQGVAINAIEDAQETITSTVLGMAQDRQGFLWLATRGNGLVRYDGHSFITYRHDADKNSLTFDYVENIAIDSAGFIWLAPFHRGLDRLDPITGLFTHFEHDINNPHSLACDNVNAILTDYTGALWIATHEGLDRLDRGSTTFIHYRFDPNDNTSISCNSVKTLYQDKDSILWIGTGSVFMQGVEEYKTLGGLNRFDSKTGKFIRYLHDLKDERSLIDNRVTAIFEDSRGTFWVGTAGDGLHTMDRRTGSFNRHRYKPSRPNELCRPPLKPSFDWAEDFISIITESFDGKIIIGTFSNGINVYDRTTHKTTWYGSDDNAAVKLADHLFWRAYITRDKTLWIGAWDGKLYRVSRHTDPIIHHTEDSLVVALMEDTDETLWIGSLSGLVRKDIKGNREKYFIDPANKNSIANHVFPVYRDGSKIILASPFGLFEFDIITRSFTPYLHTGPGTDGIPSDSVPAMVKTREGDLFFQTLRGLSMMDHHTRLIHTFRHDPNDTTSLVNDQLSYIALDADDNLWAVGPDGACRFNRALKNFKRYRIGELYYIMKDSKGILWTVGTEGLFSYDRQLDEFVTFKDAFQLISRAGMLTGAIVEDSKNNLWIGGTLGIVELLAPDKMRPLILPWAHDVKPNLTLGLLRRNGNILFGSMQGYYEINPALLTKSKMQHSVVIERFLLNNVPVFPSKDGVMKHPISITKEIQLFHDQNTFAFEFTDIDFSETKNEPAIIYKLEQYDHAWRNGTSPSSVNYFNVPPGRYKFRVKSFDLYGNESEASLLIVIAPPWWNTWWAYAGFVIGALGITCLAYFTRISSLRKQQAAQLRVMVAIQEDERKRISRDLHDDVGTKLSALKLFLTSLREKVSTHGDAEADALATTTEKFIGETMSDVRALLANLSPSVLEEFGYIVAVEGLINKLNETRRACFKLSVFGMGQRLKPAYELALYRITQELINNVVKHAGAHSVSLQIGQRDERIILMIEDDGKGFDASLKTGGYGIKNLTARCKLMHGSMTIDSRPGLGTSVLIEIPYAEQSL
jgi:signal transduction histidine kinase/ligand-binding sensor domain-containing protein